MSRYATNTLVLITLALLASLMLMVSAAKGETLHTGLNLLSPVCFSTPGRTKAKSLSNHSPTGQNHANK